MDLSALLLTFAAIFVVELPDKTFLATLVLATRYRPVLVWIGVSLAFAVQTIVAVGLGHLATYLPENAVRIGAAGMFLIGGVLLFREGLSHHRASGEEFRPTKDVYGLQAVLASFLVLFAAEWGDLSQLLTISLVAKYAAPVEVFIGALAALVTVSGLAVVAGRTLLRLVSLHALHYLGSFVCFALATVTIVELVS